MAYIDQDTAYRFTVPQQGEVDSAESVKEMVEEIDAALIDPGKKAQLESRGESVSFVSSSASEWHDPGFVLDPYANKWVTNLHSHPTPSAVPYADAAGSTLTSDTAESCTTAKQLSPGFNINGHQTDGKTDVTVSIADIPDAQRVFYGTVDPARFSFPVPPKVGDIYVRYTP